MPRTAKANELSKLIESLQAERREHLDAIAGIDATFSQFGINADGGSVRRASAGRPANGRRKGAKKKASKKAAGTRRRRGGRGQFATTGEESVLGFVKSHGKPNTKEVNVHWSGEGRGGKADNALSKLVKEKKLKRVKSKNERGSRYQIA